MSISASASPTSTSTSGKGCTAPSLPTINRARSNPFSRSLQRRVDRASGVIEGQFVKKMHGRVRLTHYLHVSPASWKKEADTVCPRAMHWKSWVAALR